VGAGGDRVLAGGQARLGPCGAALRVDVERPHVREVEHDPTVGDAVALDAVTAAPDRELQAGIAHLRDDAGDVRSVRDPHDRGRPPVDPAVEDGPGAVVILVAGRDDPTLQFVRQFRHGEHGVPSVCSD
jgi:hypothetical protein